VSSTPPFQSTEQLLLSSRHTALPDDVTAALSKNVHASAGYRNLALHAATQTGKPVLRPFCALLARVIEVKALLSEDQSHQLDPLTRSLSHPCQSLTLAKLHILAFTSRAPAPSCILCLAKSEVATALSSCSLAHKTTCLHLAFASSSKRERGGHTAAAASRRCCPAAQQRRDSGRRIRSIPHR
jgi:hypothetical protein